MSSAKVPTASVQDGVAKGSNYGQILKSSSIIGGSQGVNILIGMVRTKLVAILLGPSGVGLVGLYTSSTSFIGAFSGLGIGTSGIREVAEAHGTGDTDRIARVVQTLRRACWLTGCFGWLLTIALSYPLSLWTFGSIEHATTIALLGATLLLGSITAGQCALLQGTRRIADLASLNVIAVAVGTVVTIAIYYFLGERGIVPVLLATAIVNLGFSWWFSRKVEIPTVYVSWAESWQISRRLVKFGFAFMSSVLLMAAVSLTIQSLVVSEFGLDANGVYQAAWAISGMFAGIVLGAMGTDFYPRLTAVSHDHVLMNRFVNEQIEIGILLSLPGLLATLAFAPWIMQVFYSEKFLNGSELLPWFVLGIFGQVLSWPIEFALAALGAGGWYFTAGCFSNILRLLLSFFLLRWLGLCGIAVAIPILYFFYNIFLLWICRRLTRFKLSDAAIKLMLQSAILISMGFSIQKCVPGFNGMAIGVVLVAFSFFLSIRGLAKRLGSDHRIVRLVHRIPGGRIACGK
jgi:enterobacterial common antigen flippase